MELILARTNVDCTSNNYFPLRIACQKENTWIMEAIMEKSYCQKRKKVVDSEMIKRSRNELIDDDWMLGC